MFQANVSIGFDWHMCIASTIRRFGDQGEGEPKEPQDLKETKLGQLGTQNSPASRTPQFIHAFSPSQTELLGQIGILNARHRIRAGLAGLGGPSSSSGVGGSESQSSLLLSTLVCGSKCSTVCYFCIFFLCPPLRNQ